jgi:hypothetical protein
MPVLAGLGVRLVRGHQVTFFSLASFHHGAGGGQATAQRR